MEYFKDCIPKNANFVQHFQGLQGYFLNNRFFNSSFLPVLFPGFQGLADTMQRFFQLTDDSETDSEGSKLFLRWGRRLYGDSILLFGMLTLNIKKSYLSF